MTQEQLMALYVQACELELQTFKPGNVSVYADGHDMVVDDFRLSAQVSAKSITNSNYSLGEKIYYAVQHTREVVGCNTNLGILLLAAPLFEAVKYLPAVNSLQKAVERVLSETTIADANWVFKAIALANPGGLGCSGQQDVHGEASVSLVEAMDLAKDKDRIAVQYATGYKDVFNLSILMYNSAISRSCDPRMASLSVYVGLLSHFPDSHIERKYGGKYSEMVKNKMKELSIRLLESNRLSLFEDALYEIDSEFKELGINPGTTADLTVATLLAVFIQDHLALS
jgi:triphosphoribosyl-dephospho-CoA synthase